MPVYTYECESCGERFEARQSFNDEPLTVCPTCEGKLYRVIQPVGVVFKGSGFYVTDSRGKQNLATGGTRKEDAKPSDGGSGGEDSGAKSDTAKSDTAKSDTATSTASTDSKTETKVKPAASSTSSE